MAKHNSKIKSTAPSKSGKKILPTQKDTIEMPKYDYPIFCFKHLHPEYNLNECDDDDKKSFAERVVKLSGLTWQEIQFTQKHGWGSEKIDVNSLKVKPPAFITEDVDFLLALRFNGKKPMLGHKHHFIYHVIFIDRDFSVYDHG